MLAFLDRLFTCQHSAPPLALELAVLSAMKIERTYGIDAFVDFYAEIARTAERRDRALRAAFRTIRREIWSRRELELRRVTDLGENWTIA